MGRMVRRRCRVVCGVSGSGIEWSEGRNEGSTVARGAGGEFDDAIGKKGTTVLFLDSNKCMAPSVIKYGYNGAELS